MNLNFLVEALQTNQFLEDAGVSTSRPRVFRIPRLHDELISDQSIQYLCIKGGRGGFKTTSFICSMIEESYVMDNCAFLFAREIAKSISDSVYSVVVDLIRNMGEGTCPITGIKYGPSDFAVQQTSITNTKTNVKFIFTGLRATGGTTAMSQINKVKGLHKIRRVFLEEGQDLTENSINVLFPTVNRKGTAMLMRPVAEEENAVEGARFYVAMNPNREIDPIVSKIGTLGGTVAHINMMDIAEDEPEMRDEQLINQMELERGEYYFPHVWEGAPFHEFSGLPFANHRYEHVNPEEIVIIDMWLDPSFKGKDYTALAFLGHNPATGEVIMFGRCWKTAWNVAPAFTDTCDLIRKWEPTKFYYEDNSLGFVPRTLFAQEGINATAVTSLLNKEDKIFKVAAFTRDSIIIAENLCDSKFVELTRNYNDEAENDDPPDSLASLIIQNGFIRERLKF